MEFSFSPFRLLLLAAIVISFWLWGGFSVPNLPEDDYRDPSKVARAWGQAILLFLAGAVAVSVIDHYVGNLDRTNLRLLYILVGIIMMIGSVLWLKGMRSPITDLGQRHSSAALLQSLHQNPIT
ncbi:hypothetical protein FEM03_16820 [Phragmitibacter flavus]|uniref:Uncharacterized protein n=1 Tax=Phragmitibacter flavus TaxID=2576071 RepID=A0A5R8KBD6_9BACT|nr:hypothetical protein [Phragmitibacter flavus]TLD69620.1 hypothetical protein FEM03_16820 [Phragmitibacter flavus]